MLLKLQYYHWMKKVRKKAICISKNDVFILQNLSKNNVNNIASPLKTTNNLIKWYYPATCLCLSPARTWISLIRCRGFFFVFSEFSYDERWLFVLLTLVDLIIISFHHCLNFLFINNVGWFLDPVLWQAQTRDGVKPYNEITTTPSWQLDCDLTNV